MRSGMRMKWSLSIKGCGQKARMRLLPDVWRRKENGGF